MRDLTAEELALAPKWANRYFIKHGRDVYFISSTHFRAVLIGVNDKPFSISQGCIELANSMSIPLIKKPFDITKHNWNGVDFEGVDSDGDISLSQSYYVDSFYISKRDAIALAKHFNLTAEDLL